MPDPFAQVLGPRRGSDRSVDDDAATPVLETPLGRARAFMEWANGLGRVFAEVASLERGAFEEREQLLIDTAAAEPYRLYLDPGHMRFGSTPASQPDYRVWRVLSLDEGGEPDGYIGLLSDEGNGLDGLVLFLDDEAGDGR